MVAPVLVLGLQLAEFGHGRGPAGRAGLRARRARLLDGDGRSSALPVSSLALGIRQTQRAHCIRYRYVSHKGSYGTLTPSFFRRREAGGGAALGQSPPHLAPHCGQTVPGSGQPQAHRNTAFALVASVICA